MDLFNAEPSKEFTAAIAASEQTRLQKESNKREARKTEPLSWHDRSDKLWKGWLLPASDADTWFGAGSAEYYRLLQTVDIDAAMEAQKIRYRELKLSPDTPANHFRMEETAGTLFLDSAGTRYQVPDLGDGPAYLANDIGRRIASAATVYGTTREAGTNRYVAGRCRPAIEIAIHRLKRLALCRPRVRWRRLYSKTAEKNAAFKAVKKWTSQCWRVGKARARPARCAQKLQETGAGKDVPWAVVTGAFQIGVVLMRDLTQRGLRVCCID